MRTCVSLQRARPWGVLLLLLFLPPAVGGWETSGLQVAVPKRAWRFDSSQPHRGLIHERRTVDTALALAPAGTSASAIARQIGVPRSTVRDWLVGAVPRCPHAPRRRCGERHAFLELP